MNTNNVYETTFTYRIRVCTYTAHGGAYMRDIPIPLSFDSVEGYHSIIMNYLYTEGVPRSQLSVLRACNIRYTCPETREQNMKPSSMGEVPDGSVLYYYGLCPPEVRSLSPPERIPPFHLYSMLMTQDPEYVHVFFNGHRLSIPFPCAQDDFAMLRHVVDSMRDVGIHYPSIPSVATVAQERSSESPRELYDGRRSLHTRSLELIGYWELIPPKLKEVAKAPLLAVHCDPHDILKSLA